MTDGERLSALEEVLSDLAELSRTHVLVVEGRKDCAALNNLGISGDMFMTQSGGGLVRAGEYVASRGGRSVVLTDWDDRGDRLAERLEEVLGKSPEDTDSRYAPNSGISAGCTSRTSSPWIPSFSACGPNLYERRGTYPRR